MSGTMILTGLFWLALAVILYTYLGFPLLVALRAWFPKPFHRSQRFVPSVSVIIAAHNEVRDLGRKLDRVLEGSYPLVRLEVLVASDGSTDGTDELIDRYASAVVHPLHLSRRGKAATLNATVAAARGEILVFTDANSLFVSDTLEQLVAPLIDPQVGGVAGNQVYEPRSSAAATETGEQVYWSLDRWLKTAQSRYGNVTSATGALYAIRRELFQQVPDGVTDDFITSTRVIAQGRRLVFAPQALVLEPVATSSNIEFGRKVRVITRGLRGVWMMRELLNPCRYGFYSLQLFSHKVLRRLVVFPLAVLLWTSIGLWGERSPGGSIYPFVAVSQIAFYGLAAIAACGASLRWGQGPAKRFKVLALPLYFCVVNVAALLATVKFLRGQQIVIWEPARQATNE